MLVTNFLVDLFFEGDIMGIFRKMIKL